MKVVLRRRVARGVLLGAVRGRGGGRAGGGSQVGAADAAEAVVFLQRLTAAGTGGELVELRHRHTHVLGRKRLAASTSSVRSLLVGASLASLR